MSLIINNNFRADQIAINPKLSVLFILSAFAIIYYNYDTKQQSLCPSGIGIFLLQEVTYGNEKATLPDQAAVYRVPL